MYMVRIIFSFISIILWLESAFAVTPLTTGVEPTNSLFSGGSGNGWWLIELLGKAEEFLLKVALPLVIIGTALYIAYELFLAEWNEEKVKKAWKSLTYWAIGAICIAFGYAVISLVSRFSL